MKRIYLQICSNIALLNAYGSIVELCTAMRICRAYIFIPI